MGLEVAVLWVGSNTSKVDFEKPGNSAAQLQKTELKLFFRETVPGEGGRNCLKLVGRTGIEPVAH